MHASVRNRGGLVTGLVGIGNSVGLTHLRDHLRNNGEQVYVCAYTHTGARLVGGVAVSRLLHYEARVRGGWSLVDETS